MPTPLLEQGMRVRPTSTPHPVSVTIRIQHLVVSMAIRRPGQGTRTQHQLRIITRLLGVAMPIHLPRALRIRIPLLLAEHMGTQRQVERMGIHPHLMDRHPMEVQAMARLLGHITHHRMGPRHMGAHPMEVRPTAHRTMEHRNMGVPRMARHRMGRRTTSRHPAARQVMDLHQDRIPLQKSTARKLNGHGSNASSISSLAADKVF